MRGTLVEWLLVIAGLLGLIGLAYSDFQPSTGLLYAACVVAVALALWAIKAQPRPEEVYSPLQGRRRKVRSELAPLWIIFPMALVAGWLFTVYGVGMTLASVAGVAHTRTGTVVYSARHKPSARSRQPVCTLLSVVLKTERGPVRIEDCDASLGGSTLTGFDVTYRTRESALGLFFNREPGVPQLDDALEMARQAEEQAAHALEHAARAQERR
ncbi:TPA: hypothetical protein QDZ10_001882 [Stenotrophomonas maltophilia]|nr:hypothetical protein [Stenotrophomonas maltophilia]